MSDKTITEEEAKEALGIEPNDWIITVKTHDLAIMKNAMRLHAEESSKIADFLESIG